MHKNPEQGPPSNKPLHRTRNGGRSEASRLALRAGERQR